MWALYTSGFLCNLSLCKQTQIYPFYKGEEIIILYQWATTVLSYIQLLTSELFGALCFCETNVKTSTTICLPVRDYDLTCFCWNCPFSSEKEHASTIQETTNVKFKTRCCNPSHVPIMWNTGGLCRYTTWFI